jgi:hypothetical protein
MPFPMQHQYVTVIGDAYNATERWQFGFRITDGGVSNQATVDALWNEVSDWWTGTNYDAPSAFGASPRHRLTEVKVARIGTDGQYPDDEVAASHFFVPPIAGNSAALAGQIPQATMAATLVTAKPRGLASKGRVYLPCSNRYQPGTDGLVPADQAVSIANSVWTMFSRINANELVGNVAVFSRGRGVPSYNQARNRIEYTYPNPGAYEVVTGVQVGRVVDTQRRRRRQLVENYQSDTV